MYCRKVEHSDNRHNKQQEFYCYRDMATRKTELTKGKIQDFERRFVDKEKGAIKLRTRERANGCFVIYLDMYIGDGKHKCETINVDNQPLYLVPENGRNDTINKTRNNKTWEQAKAVKAQRIIDKQNGELGFNLSAERRNIEVLAYLKKLDDEAKQDCKERHIHLSSVSGLYNHFKTFLNGSKVTFAQFDKDIILRFIDYLRNSAYKRSVKSMDRQQISPGTQLSLYRALSTAMKRAVHDKIIDSNPCDDLTKDEKPKKHKSNISYLNIDEVQKLLNTRCVFDVLKRAFLFGCSTGLRASDIANLTWGQICDDDYFGKVIRLKVKKTQQEEIFPLPSLALHVMPERGDAADKDLIFPSFYESRMGEKLQKWADDAGINKKVRFHVSRHTAATINLSLGVPIETVSKLLGHSNINTTQIYAEVINESKKKAVSLQDKAFKFD